MQASLGKRYVIGLAAAAVVLFAAVCHRLLETPQWSYNGARLMPSFAVINGLNYYVVFPPGGPLYSSLYGPMAAIVYLPATLFHSPNTAVLAGAAITALFCFSAAAFLHFTPSRASRTGADWLAFLTTGLLMCYLEPLKYSCFNVHADGPGLAFGAVAAGALYPGRPQNVRAALPVSALCAVLSVFCKQTFLPVPFVLLFYLWVAAGRARAIHYLAWLIAMGGAACATALICIGPERLYHCLIWVPGHHPWYPPSGLVSAIQAMRGFIRLSMPVPVLWLACAIYLSGSLRARGLRVLAANRAAPLLLLGIALLPFSIAARAKQGGDVNSLSFSLFFLTCGLTVLLADGARNASSATTRRMSVSVLAATLLALAVSEAPLALEIPAAARRLPQSPQQVALAYLQRHPGEAYFPWIPLAHYYAEHQFRHYAYGIADRLMAGESFTEADFRAYIPRDPRVIAFAADGTPRILDYDLMQYLPEYSRTVNDPELPGWLVYAKSGLGSTAPWRSRSPQRPLNTSRL
ncbi:MAG: hypothetical protein ACLP59_33145 [Bryobacteraceae bacterium]